jgi:Zn-dependent protease with chaperone function
MVFAAGIIAYVVAVNLLFFVWLGGDDFWTHGSLKAMLWMTGLVLAAAVIQFLRLTRDGRQISGGLGGIPVAGFARGHKRHVAKVTQLQNILAELCIAASSPTPALHVQPGKHYINGFACGMRPEQWCITVTEGALINLSRDELQALIGHELTHLTTGDTRNSVLLCSYIVGLGSLTLVGLVIAAMGGGKSKEGAGLALVGLVLALFGALGALVALVLEASLSREQEFRADAGAVRLTRSSDAMVSLLTRLAEELSRERGNRMAGSFEFSWDAIAMRPMNFNHGAKGFWLDSHPPLVDRIRVFDPSAAARVETLLGCAR